MRIGIFIILAWMTGLQVAAADYVIWYPKARSFDLSVKSMPLKKFLGMIRAETGWEVVMEPGLTQVVDGQFRNRSAPETMRAMLGRTRFSLLPRAQGGTRLKVYSQTSRGATQAVEEVLLEAFRESPVQALPEDDGRLLTLPVKVHYVKSQFAALNADSKMTNLRPLFAGVNEIWRRGNIRFTLGVPKTMVLQDQDAERTYANLFKPEVTPAVVRQFMARTVYTMLPDLPDRGKVLHLIVVHTLPQGYGAFYMPSKGMVVMAQVKYADLVAKGGVWKNGSDVFFAQSNVLAHEFGHALSLKHVATQGNLMIDGVLREGSGTGPGTALTQKQVQSARKQAMTGGPYVPGINPKPDLKIPKED